MGIARPDLAEEGAADTQLLPNISPTMEAGVLERLPDLEMPEAPEGAGAAGVHEGREGWWDQAGAAGLEEGAEEAT